VPDYNPRTENPRGVPTDHIGGRWREKIDPNAQPEAATNTAMEAFKRSEFILTTKDYKDELMHYYIHITPGGRGIMFVQDPANLRVVTLYPFSYIDPEVDQVILQMLLDKWKDARDKKDERMLAISRDLANLDIEQNQIAQEREALNIRTSRVAAARQTLELQASELQASVDAIGYKLTHSVEYSLEARRGRSKHN
jgi:hypothetical protein